ncbi:MAG: NAD-dependent epimerase/dehydratase family protein [Candidatus Xenobiia bacterium LiM19]
MSPIKSILITGGTGFIGSALTRKLAERGYKISLLVRPSSDLDNIKDSRDRIKIFVYEDTIESLYSIVENSAADVIIHLAAFFTAEHKEHDIVPLLNSNILLGTFLLEAVRKFNIHFFVATSSHHQHYNREQYNPVNLYAATKQAFETIAKYYLETCDLRMLTLELFGTYGPFDKRPKVMTLLKRISSSGEELKMSPGEQEIGLVYIDDVVKAYLRCLEIVTAMNKGEHRKYVAAPRESLTLRQVVQIFEEASGKKLNIRWGEKTYREREMMKIWRGEPNILDDMDTIDMYEGIRKMLALEKFSDAAEQDLSSKIVEYKES